MKNKEEIRLYLDTQFSPSEDDMVQIVRNDFDRILNSAASCALITVEGAMPVLAEQLRTELEALHTGANLDVIVKVNYHPVSEISFDDLCSLLTVIHEFAPQVKIVWGCGTDAKLAELFDSVADRDIGRVNLQDLPKTYWQVALLNSDRRYCDTITAHIAMNPIKFIIRLFGATV